MSSCAPWTSSVGTPVGAWRIGSASGSPCANCARDAGAEVEAVGLGEVGDAGLADDAGERHVRRGEQREVAARGVADGEGPLGQRDRGEHVLEASCATVRPRGGTRR